MEPEGGVNRVSLDSTSPVTRIVRQRDGEPSAGAFDPFDVAHEVVPVDVLSGLIGKRELLTADFDVQLLLEVLEFDRCLTSGSQMSRYTLSSGMCG